jgi:hypothetical protein
VGRFAAQHPYLTICLTLLGLGVVVTYWYVFALAAALVVAGWDLRAATVRYDRTLLARARHRQLLAAHADFEHHCLINGDPRGVYGQYPPRI